MKADDVINMRWGAVPIPFHVEVSWSEDQLPRKLIHDTVIEGAKNHKLTVVSPLVPGMFFCYLHCIFQVFFISRL